MEQIRESATKVTDLFAFPFGAFASITGAQGNVLRAEARMVAASAPFLKRVSAATHETTHLCVCCEAGLF